MFNSRARDWLRTSEGVAAFSHKTFFNILLERIMSEASEYHKGSVSIKGRIIIDFRFDDNNAVIADEEEEVGGSVTQYGYELHSVHDGDWS